MTVRPPVEALPDLAWMRIERALWNALDAAPAPPKAIAKRRSRVWIAGPAIAAALAVVWIAPWRSAPQPSTLDLPPVRMVSGAAPSSLSFGDVHVTLEADSALAMARDLTALLERGGARLAVAPRAGRDPLLVIAGDVTITAANAQLRVLRDGETIVVTVERGSIELRYRGDAREVRAGQRWSSSEPRAASATPAREMFVMRSFIRNAPDARDILFNQGETR